MIGIVFIGDLKYCPYLEKYIQIFDKYNIDYEVLFWNRENADLNIKLNYLALNKYSKLNRSPICKVADFLYFRRWLIQTIKKNNYDRLVILSTLSGILVFDLLVKKYNRKYVFDIRDYSYENIKAFYKIEESLIDCSYFTCISAKGFEAFLPSKKYIISNNFNYSDLKYTRIFQKKIRGAALNLVWIGAIRYFDHQIKIINHLKNDPRFHMIFHGSGPDLRRFKKYCNENLINNIEFTGEYNNQNKYKLLEPADLLNNSYGLENESEVKYAIANKFYDGLIFRIPQLVEINTYKEQLVRNLGVGIGIDVNDDKFADKLYAYYFSVVEVKYNDTCKKQIEEIIEEDKLHLKKIAEFATMHKYQ